MISDWSYSYHSVGTGENQNSGTVNLKCFITPSSCKRRTIPFGDKFRAELLVGLINAAWVSQGKVSSTVPSRSLIGCGLDCST